MQYQPLAVCLFSPLHGYAVPGEAVSHLCVKTLSFQLPHSAQHCGVSSWAGKPEEGLAVHGAVAWDNETMTHFSLPVNFAGGQVSLQYCCLLS